MNSNQKKICLIFAIFFFVAGIIFLSNEKSLTGVISIALSGMGLFFILGEQKEKLISEKETTFIKKILMSKRFKMAFKIAIIGIAIIGVALTLLILFTRWSDKAYFEKQEKLKAESKRNLILEDLPDYQKQKKANDYSDLIQPSN